MSVPFSIGALVMILVAYLFGRHYRIYVASEIAERSLAEAKAKESNARIAFLVEIRKIVTEWHDLKKTLDEIHDSAKSINDFRTRLERDRALIPEKPKGVTSWENL